MIIYFRAGLASLGQIAAFVPPSVFLSVFGFLPPIGVSPQSVSFKTWELDIPTDPRDPPNDPLDPPIDPSNDPLDPPKYSLIPQIIP